MKTKILTIILCFNLKLFFSQEKHYNFPLIDGNKMVTMKQSNQLVQEGNRFLANLVIKDKKTEKYC